MAFAQFHFERGKRAGGAAVADHLASVARQLGKLVTAVDAAPPALPLGARLIWRAFLELHKTRGALGFGPASITYAEIFAWQRVMHSRLLPWEVDALRLVDDAFLTSLDHKPETVTPH
jgi:hypothetical protein